MKFESQENAYFFYTHYAKCVGFYITSRCSKINRQFIDVKHAFCTGYEEKREYLAFNLCPCLKVECEAYLQL